MTVAEDYGTARAVKNADTFLDDPFLIISERETLGRCMLVDRTGAGE